MSDVTAEPPPEYAGRHAATAGQLEQAAQIRTVIAHQIAFARVVGHDSVSLGLDDAESLERLLDDSLRHAQRLGACP